MSNVAPPWVMRYAHRNNPRDCRKAGVPIGGGDREKLTRVDIVAMVDAPPFACTRHNETMKLLAEQSGHEEAIRRVILDAFGRIDEARLTDELRSSGNLAFSIVAEQAGEVCGHVALSRLRSPAGALTLGPVSVLKAKQRQGIGCALIRRAVERAREGSYEIIFVLGEPQFYTRFGFAAEEAASFPCRYAGPHLMALKLKVRSIEPAPIVYPDVFDKLE